MTDQRHCLSRDSEDDKDDPDQGERGTGDSPNRSGARRLVRAEGPGRAVIFPPPIEIAPASARTATRRSSDPGDLARDETKDELGAHGLAGTPARVARHDRPKSGEQRIELLDRRINRSLEDHAAAVVVIDPYQAARAQAAAILRADSRFQVQQLADLRAFLERMKVQRDEGYLVALDRDPRSGYELIHQIRLGDPDASIFAVDARECAERASTAMKAGADGHLILPLHHKDLHQLAARVQLARSAPKQFGYGPVRIRIDIGLMSIDGISHAIGKSTEISVITKLCLAYGNHVHEDVLLDAGGYGQQTREHGRGALRKLLQRSQEKLGAYRSCLNNNGSSWRLELPNMWPQLP